MASSSKTRKTSILVLPSSSSNMEIDRISDLPENVLDIILSHLPIKDALKTSVLSTKWRFKYTTLSNIVFDRDFSYFYRGAKLDSIIDGVLFLHSGPIHKFELTITRGLPTNEIEKWIHYLSRCHLKVLKLSIYIGVIYRMPALMFTCQSLTHLDLSYFSLRPPSTFRGFRNLKGLRLRDVDIDEDVLKSLISSSPVLEMFAFYYYERDFYHLCIDAPNLQQLTIGGKFVHLSLENAPLLNVITIDGLLGGTEVCGDAIYFKKLLASMPQIQRIDIGCYYLHTITNGDVPRDIQAPLVNLYHLSIGVTFTRFKETLYLRGLLKCAPNLQELHVSCNVFDVWELRSIVWDSDDWNRPFTHLRCIKIIHFSGLKPELEFFSFMLLASFALETMTIAFASFYKNRKTVAFVKQSSKAVKQLLSLSRASPKAKIIILED